MENTMNEIVLIVKPSIMEAHGKTPANLESLIGVLNTYGSVESLDDHLSAIKLTYQQEVADLARKLETLKGYDLTQDEMALVNLFRKLCQLRDKQHIAELEKKDAEAEELRKQLADVKTEMEKRIDSIKQFIAQS